MNIQRNLIELMNEERSAMRQSKLFTPEEIRKMIDMRTLHNRRIQSAPNNLACFKDYISNDESLLKTIAMRRKKTKSAPKENSIEHTILKRMKLLYEAAMVQFPNESEVLVSFLRFCRKVNYMNLVSITVSGLLEKFPGNVHSYLALAKWYAYECSAKTKAMVTLLQGVQQHPNNELLYKEIIKLEMTELAMHCSQTMESVNEQQLCVQRIQDAVNMAFDNISNGEFYVDILEMLESNSLTSPTQDIIIGRLKEDCSDNEKVWHVLAQRERNDLYCTYDVPKIEGNKFERKVDTEKQEDNKEVVYENQMDFDQQIDIERKVKFQKKVDMCMTKRTPRARLEACFAKYRQGLAVIPIERKKYLWRLYIDFLLGLQKETRGGGTVLKLETLKTALNDASAEFCLLEKHYLLWLKLLDNDKKEALVVAEKGTNAIPHSFELWTARLRLQMLNGELEDVEEVFRMGVMNLKHKALPLWQSMLRYYALSEKNDKIVKLYEDGVKQPEDVSDVMKPKYLQWVILNNGMDPGRKLYTRLATQEPYCKVLHKIMCKYELMDMENFPFWQKALELACRQFGREDADVWIAYIQFYVRYNRIPDRLKRIEDIYKEANKRLSKQYIYHLNSLYTQIMNELS